MGEFLRSIAQNLPEWLPQLLVACGETLKLTAVSFLIAAMGGVLVALVRRSGSRTLRAAAIVYIEIARGMHAADIDHHLRERKSGHGAVGSPPQLLRQRDAAVADKDADTADVAAILRRP